ncbi:beta-lactamase/transpeptidase-like protein [Ilyonectria destructans]|nr:beta-lactamase/transpeptidase-like protein [Ilyonectria destructans]
MSPIQDILPEFKPYSPDLDGTVSVTDFLSHRTGLLGDMSVANQGDLDFLIHPAELLPTVANLETVALFRQNWIYNNWGYSVASTVIEKLTKKPFYDYINDAVVDPLGLHNTTTRPVSEQDANFAEAYMALADSTFHLLPRAFPFKGSIFEAAGGMYSTVNDMLKYAQAVLKAERDPQSSPLKNMGILQSYQLPGVVGLQGDNADLFNWDELPTLGSDSAPVMTYYHQGAALGYYSSIFTFPESQSAVVVFTISLPLNDAADWIAQVLVSALFGFSNSAYHVELARESRCRKFANVAAMRTEFERIKNHHPIVPRPLGAYVGRYYNDLQNFFIDIHVFEWALDYDQSARRARFAISDPKYFEIDFQLDEENKPSCFRWAKWSGICQEGMPMTRHGGDETISTSVNSVSEDSVPHGEDARFDGNVVSWSTALRIDRLRQ